MMTEVVTPSGKGCSYGPPVATEIRSRVQLFVDSGITTRDYVLLWEWMRHLDRARTLMRVSVFTKCS
jgi:hypothetical protein